MRIYSRQVREGILKPIEDGPIFYRRNSYRTPLIMAHRGGNTLAPQNSLPAFERSCRSGVWALETDIRLTKDGEAKDGICVGDGPIDASFLAIEQITGTHYELDDFQIRAVTEGREAMGETVVRLRSDGKLYSGRGISTDVVGSSILAYINALNKIVYEESQK